MGGDIEEYPFIFMNTPASLQILCSVEMALMVWRCKYANTSHLYKKPRIFFEQEFSCKEVLVAPVPRRIQAQINEKIASIGEELRKWIDFHSDRGFLRANSAEEIRKCFKHIAVDFSGSIGCKTSAINMLNSGEFSDVVNYKLACMYCLENEIKRFWPSVANKWLVDVNPQHDQSCSSYWYGWMKSGGNSITDTELVKRLVMNTPLITAFDYFIKMLPDHERVSEIISLVRVRSFSINYRAPMRSLTLHTLGRVQAEEVFKKQASSIFKVLTKNDKNFQYAHRLWTLMGHLILENESQFFPVVSELWKLSFSDHSSDGLNFTERGQINDLLLETWSHASAEMKAYISKKFWHEILLRCYIHPIEFHTCYGHDVTFALEIVSKWSGKDKNIWWRGNWRRLALHSKPAYLEQFVRICLPNENAIELFKNKLTNFERLFRLLIEEGFYSDLKDYLMFCSKDAEQLKRLAKKVLGSNVDIIFFHDEDKFANFDWFVSEVFSNVKKDIDEFKAQMSSLADCLKFLLATCKTDEASSNDFGRIISRLVTDEGKLQRVKRELFEHCRTYPADCKCTSETFNATQWQMFLEWCTGDHEEISAFKRSLNVDVIFLKRLKDYLCDEYCVEVLDFLDDFLTWYFGNEEDAKNFKLEKVKNYKEIDILRVEMERNNRVYPYLEDSMYRLLLWFFDNNDEDVGEFWKTCNQCRKRKRTDH